MTDTNSILRELRAREARALGIAPDARTPARDRSAAAWTALGLAVWSCAIALALTAGYWLGSAVK